MPTNFYIKSSIQHVYAEHLGLPRGQNLNGRKWLDMIIRVQPDSEANK